MEGYGTYPSGCHFQPQENANMCELSHCHVWWNDWPCEVKVKPHDLVSHGILLDKLGTHGLDKQVKNCLDCQAQGVVHRHWSLTGSPERVMFLQIFCCLDLFWSPSFISLIKHLLWQTQNHSFSWGEPAVCLMMLRQSLGIFWLFVDNDKLNLLFLPVKTHLCTC